MQPQHTAQHDGTCKSLRPPRLQERAKQAFFIDELTRELRETSSEAERLRTILAGAAWYKEKERLERRSNSPVPPARQVPNVRDARLGYSAAEGGVGSPAHSAKLM